jgi:hypothetical protein
LRKDRCNVELTPVFGLAALTLGGAVRLGLSGACFPELGSSRSILLRSAASMCRYSSGVRSGTFLPSITSVSARVSTRSSPISSAKLL